MNNKQLPAFCFCGSFAIRPELNSKDGFLTPLSKQLAEAALAAELEQRLGETDQPNRKNASTDKLLLVSYSTKRL